MGALKVTVLLVFCVLQVAVHRTQAISSKKFRKLLKDYTKDPPEGPTEVRLGIYVNSIYSISEQTMDYSLSMYFRQAWQDERLKFQPEDGEKKKIMVPDNAIGNIWLPDTFFRNEKRANFHSVTVPNRLLRLNATGHTWYVTKISTTLSCPMKLHKFPFDTQMCPLMFESFANTMDTMYFSWLKSPVDVDSSVHLPRYTLNDVILYDCSQNYTAGAFPCLEIRFVLQRDTGFYIMQIFIPSIFIVILSWAAFWFAIDAVAARVGISLMTLLSLFILSAWSRTQIPGISYVTAMDIWMSACFFFVLASFVEYAIVQYLSRSNAEQASEASEKGAENEDGPSIKMPIQCSPKCKRSANFIDCLCRIVFPLAFLVFNIIYWAIYTS